MPTKLTPAEMKQFVRDHFEDFVNRQNAAVIRKNMTPDFYDHDGPGGKPTGVDGDEQMMLAMYKAMPDLHLKIEDMIAEGDKIVCRNIWRWTDPASGKKMQFHGFVLWRFEGDKIAERWATVTPPLEGTSWTEAQEPAAQATREWAKGIEIAARIDEMELAEKLLKGGMGDVERLKGEDLQLR